MHLCVSFSFSSGIFGIFALEIRQNCHVHYLFPVSPPSFVVHFSRSPFALYSSFHFPHFLHLFNKSEPCLWLFSLWCFEGSKQAQQVSNFRARSFSKKNLRFVVVISFFNTKPVRQMSPPAQYVVDPPPTPDWRVSLTPHCFVMYTFVHL